MEKSFSTMLGVGLAVLMSAGFVKSEKLTAPYEC